jgi:hypothetical protein
MISVVAST